MFAPHPKTQPKSPQIIFTLCLWPHVRTTIWQLVQTTDDSFTMEWPMFATTVSGYHLDARKMANKIPKLDYGMLHRCFDSRLTEISLMKLPSTTPDCHNIYINTKKNIFFLRYWSSTRCPHQDWSASTRRTILFPPNGIIRSTKMSWFRSWHSSRCAETAQLSLLCCILPQAPWHTYEVGRAFVP